MKVNSLFLHSSRQSALSGLAFPGYWQTFSSSFLSLHFPAIIYIPPISNRGPFFSPLLLFSNSSKRIFYIIISLSKLMPPFVRNFVKFNDTRFNWRSIFNWLHEMCIYASCLNCVNSLEKGGTDIRWQLIYFFSMAYSTPSSPLRVSMFGSKIF